MESGFTGLEDNPYDTWHGVSDTVITLMVEDGRHVPAIQLKSGHKRAEGLFPYSKTGGEEGLMQQYIAFRVDSRLPPQEL